jgi:EAL domain-containing protein (putative c-di-GMP-specific phosphodiesterase class I)
VSARGILAGIIAIADTTGSYVIAEGIETEDILSFVRDFAPRVRALQGFYLAPPQPEPIDQPAYARGSRIVLSSSVPRAPRT